MLSKPKVNNYEINRTIRLCWQLIKHGTLHTFKKGRIKVNLNTKIKMDNLEYNPVSRYISFSLGLMSKGNGKNEQTL